MSTKPKQMVMVEMTPKELAEMLSFVAEQIIQYQEFTPDLLFKMSEIGQNLIVDMMKTHDLTFSQGIVTLMIMLESMLSMGDVPSCPSKDHIN